MSKMLPLTFALLMSAVAMAQAPTRIQAAPSGFSGELVKYSDDSVTIKDKDGKEIVIAMTKAWTVSRPRTVQSSTIKQGDFVATANKPIDDNTGQSTELRIMEAGYRPEFGTHLMNPQTAMTHGTVTKTAKTAAGVELDVTYPNGARHLIVPDDVKVTDFELLSREVLKPGMKVGGVMRKGEDGVMRAGRVTL